jgi:hypothetical protein
MTILYGMGAFPLECRLRLLARGKAELMGERFLSQSLAKAAANASDKEGFYCTHVAHS